MFSQFVHTLRSYGVPVSMDFVIEFHKGLEKNIVNDLDDLFIFARLCFIKRVEHMDPYERAFLFYFYDIDIPDVPEGDYRLLKTKQFQDWLRNAVERGDLKPVTDNLTAEELMKKFWETVKEQMEAHHGGNKWVGTGGSSPFGHSGADRNSGVRVMGDSKNRSAQKVIGERKYVDYSGTHSLRGDNLRQALAPLKDLKPSGAYSELDIGETIYETARNGGEIELIFKKELKDKLEIILLLDNGGSSMWPFIETTKTLFEKVKNNFKECTPYYFHNTIYEEVYTDARRQKPISVLKLLEKNPDTRVLIVGDASMAPDELMSAYGSLYFMEESAEPSINWLQRIRDHFKHTVWLNPISQDRWDSAYGSWTLNKIRGVFHMEELTVNGIKKAVQYLNSRGGR